MIVSYLKKNAKHSQTIRMIQRFVYVWVFVIEADKMDLKLETHCKVSLTQARRIP